MNQFYLKKLAQDNAKKLIKYSAGGAVCLLGSLVFLYKIQGKIIYHPIIQPDFPQSPQQNPSGYQNPKDYKLNYENIVIETADKIKIRGWFIKQEKNYKKCPTVVFFHENAGNIGSRLNYLNYYYHKVNVNLLIIAYRGYSDSDLVKIDQKGLEQDVEAILKYIFSRQDINLNSIYTHGRSLGGATSIYGLSLNQYPIKGAIIENTFTSIKDVGSTFLPKFIMAFANLVLKKNRWESINRIDKIQCPSLFIKSMKDELIPCEQVEKLYQKCQAPKLKYVMDNGDHNNNWANDVDEYFQNINQFIQDVENSKILQKQHLQQ